MKQILDYDKNNVWHVYPVNDLSKHQLEGIFCECNPKLSLQENKGLIVIHNAFDGRHILEKGGKFN